MSKYRRWIVLVVTLAVFGWMQWHSQRSPGSSRASGTAAHTSAVTRRLGRLAFTPCTLASEFGTQTVEAQCSRLLVPENHAAPGGRRISLAIAWIPARNEPAPDPVFMIAGGPGQSALESFPGIAGAFAEVGKKRDIVLVDQRGTGGSHKLVCTDSQGKSAAVQGGSGVLAATQAARRSEERR